VPANEKLVVMNRDVKKRATATSRAPQKLKPASKPLEISDPQIRPEESLPHLREMTKCQQEGSDKSKSPYPATVGPLRIDRAAAKPPPANHQAGHRQQKRREAKYLEQQVRAVRAIGPIQLPTAPPSETCRLTLKAASRGEYE